MSKKDIQALTEQIRLILLNEPIPSDLLVQSEEFRELQEGLSLLDDTVKELNLFLHHMAKGELDATQPSRHNYLASELKSLQSALKHLSWKATQVAKGDYAQRVTFLGEYSEAFNQMTEQLGQREQLLKDQSKKIMENNALMISVLDGLEEWVIVVRDATNEMIYKNRAAEEQFFGQVKARGLEDNCKLIDFITNKESDKQQGVVDFVCDITNRIYLIKYYTVDWNGSLSRVYFISDVTDLRKNSQDMETMAYQDVLTGLYNRRFLENYMDELLEKKASFVLCMLDADGLKYANDTYGHQAGDFYLKTVSEGLLKITGVSDVIGRFGGDEFLLIFENSSIASVETRMLRLNELLAVIPSPYTMSVSYGILAVDALNENTLGDIYSEVDKRMYADKKAKKGNS